MNAYSQMIEKLSDFEKNNNSSKDFSRSEIIELLKIICEFLGKEMSRNEVFEDIQISIKSVVESQLELLIKRLKRLENGYPDNFFDYQKMGTGRSQKLDEREFDAFVKQNVTIIKKMHGIRTVKEASEVLAKLLPKQAMLKGGRSLNAAQILRIYNRKRP